MLLSIRQSVPECRAPAHCCAESFASPTHPTLPWNVLDADDGAPDTQRFNERATEVRIDYVQHSLSAMVQYLKRTGSAIQ